MILPSNSKFSIGYLESLMRSAQTKEEDPIQKIIQRAIESSCTVFGQAGKSRWTGSGFLIGNKVIVTAGHVAGPVEEQGHIDIAVTFDAKSIYSCSVIAVDHNIDVGLLYCQEAVHLPSVKLGNSDTAEIGDIVAAIGSPQGWHDTATVGRISNIHQSLNDPSQPAWSDIIFIDADILEGASGGMCIGTDGLVYGSIVGVTGTQAELGIGERAVCPSNKIIKMVYNSIHE